MAGPAAPGAGSSSLLHLLDEDVMVEVLLAAEGEGALVPLSSCSRHLCRVARARVPSSLVVNSNEAASLVIKSHMAGRPPFSGCTYLEVSPPDSVCYLMAPSILAAARGWPALQRLKLRAMPDLSEQEQDLFMDHCNAGILSSVPPLQQLRELELDIIGFGADCARQVGKLVHLTRLKISACGSHADEPADLTALSGMTSLVELQLYAAPRVQPPAGPAGPFCFPSSLRSLTLNDIDMGDPTNLANWLPHLPGCPQLEVLCLQYADEQHPSAHPAALVPRLVQHNRQLRSLTLRHMYHPQHTEWTMEVAGLPQQPEGPLGWAWHPDAALAALPGLECLSAGRQLVVHAAGDWRQLAKMPAVTKLLGLEVYYAPPLAAPPLAAGTSLKVLELGCVALLDGRSIGLLLLACPALEVADVDIEDEQAPAPVQPPAAEPQLRRHKSLRQMTLRSCTEWGTQAAAEFAALAPVLSGVADLTLGDWAVTSPSGGAHCGLPDLSPCTAMTLLVFGCDSEPRSQQQQRRQVVPEQEDFLSMLATAKQLRQLVLFHARRLNARSVVALQWVLPHLQSLEMWHCGSALPLAASDPQQQHTRYRFQEEQEVLAKVKQQLRRGLVLQVG